MENKKASTDTFTPIQDAILTELSNALSVTPVGPAGRPDRNYMRSQRRRAQAQLVGTGINQCTAKRVCDSTAAATQH